MRITLDIPQSEINRMMRLVRAWQVRKRAQIIDLIERTAENVKADAQARVEQRTGDLKKEIKVVLEHVAEQLVGYVVADKFYARFLELGTATAKAHPFMMPAFEANVHQFLAELFKILRSER